MYKAVSTEAVYIEINDRVAISVNRLGRVINQFTINDENEKAAEISQINDVSYIEAVGTLLEKGIEHGEFKAGARLTFKIGPEENSANDRYKIIEKNIKAVSSEHSVKAQCTEIDPGIRKTAVSYGIPVGRYIMICEMQKLDSSISIDVYKDYSIKMLREIYSLLVEGKTKTEAENELGAETGKVMRFINDILFKSSHEG